MPELATAPQVYARATPRLRALIRDYLVRGTIFLAVFVPASLKPDSIRILGPIGLLALLLYEPVFLTIRGATIGQRAENLRVVRARDLAPLSFPRALLRSLVKAIFGIPAFLVMYFTDRHQALQDLAAGTVVVPYDAGRAQAGWFDPARGTDRTYMMPHWLRRLAAIVVYELVFGFVFIATIVFRLLPNCYRGRPPRVSCSAADTLLTNVIMLSLLFGLFAISVAGALGFLWGARRRLSARI